MYCDHVLSLPHTSPRPSLPTQLHILSLFKNKIKAIMKNNKSKKKGIKNQSSKTIIKKPKCSKEWNLFCVSQLRLGMESALYCGWYTQCHSSRENQFLLSQQQLLTTKSFLVRSGAFLPFSVLGVSGWKACRPWVFCHSLCEFLHTALLLCLNESSLQSRTRLWHSSCTLFNRDPWVPTSCLGLSAPNSLIHNTFHWI